MFTLCQFLENFIFFIPGDFLRCMWLYAISKQLYKRQTKFCFLSVFVRDQNILVENPLFFFQIFFNFFFKFCPNFFFKSFLILSICTPRHTKKFWSKILCFFSIFFSIFAPIFSPPNFLPNFCCLIFFPIVFLIFFPIFFSEIFKMTYWIGPTFVTLFH